MNTSQAQLSSELQELYLENKDTLSDILFLEDESRFFQKLFDKILLSPIKVKKFQEVEFVNLSMAEFQNRRNELKVMLASQQHSVESILKNSDQKIELSLINQNAAITSEIRALLSFDKTLKKELYTLVEHVMTDQDASQLVNPA